jgi:hypothetical protein
MGAHPIQWHTPAPLWGRFGATTAQAATAPDQMRPAILRFAGDDFMDQLLGLLTRDPARIGDLLARPETWRTRPGAGADLVERVALPQRAKAAALKRALTRPKTTVPLVPRTAAAVEKAQQVTLPLKLYQPAHQRYYLVAANLVCGVVGFPDRAVTQPAVEQVGFVLRRMLPPTLAAVDDGGLREFAFVKDDAGARWRRLAGDDGSRLAPGEEILPLFPLNFRDAADHARTLWSGLIPVGRREEYLGSTVDRTTAALVSAQLQSLQPPAAPALINAKTARRMQFNFEVAEPWKNLIRSSHIAAASLGEDKPGGLSDSEPVSARTARARALNMQWQMQSWLILLDFADYLAAHLPDVWAAIDPGVGAASLTGARKDLYDWLATATMTPALAAFILGKPAATSLRAALHAIGAARAGLERTELLYDASNQGHADWPAFHFLLAGLDSVLQPAGPYSALNTLGPPDADDAEPDPHPNTTLTTAQIAAEKLDRLTALVVRALAPTPETEAPPVPFALELRKAIAATVGDPGWFVIRCVHLNRECGPLHPPALSAPTQRFQLANFFDSDAPARPIRITLPTDTTPAGLRKHNKNAAFIISDLLCGQIQRARGLGLGDLVRSVLPWPLHKDLDVGGGGACRDGGGINIGMICSLSIPIITICALILLMIIVTLLDFIFRWLPYFVLCLPVPGLKGKK